MRWRGTLGRPWRSVSSSKPEKTTFKVVKAVLQAGYSPLWVAMLGALWDQCSVSNPAVRA
jgi:hypothetical protein